GATRDRAPVRVCSTCPPGASHGAGVPDRDEVRHRAGRKGWVMRRRWNGLVAAILAVVLAATACSSGDERGRAGPRREDRDETAADDGSEHRGTTSPGGPGTPPRPSSGC